MGGLRIINQAMACFKKHVTVTQIYFHTSSANSIQLCVSQLVKNSPYFLIHGVSLPCSQESDIGPYPELVYFSSYPEPVWHWALSWTSLFQFIPWTSVTLGPILNQFISVHTLNQCDIGPYPEPVYFSSYPELVYFSSYPEPVW